MKKGAAGFFKQIFNALRAMAKAKSMTLKSKTSDLKTRIIIFSLLRNKKVLMGSISDKVHALLGHQHQSIDDDQSKAIVLYKSMANESQSIPSCTQLQLVDDDQYYGQDEDDRDDKYPDLTHSLFDSDGDDDDDEFEGQNGSVIDLVRNAKEEGEDFSLEDEIDHVADLFIRRFHRQIRLEKQQSLKRYQEMLARSV